MPLCFALALAALALVWPGPAPAQGAATRLVVACPTDAPPLGHLDADGLPAGILPDFWRLFAKRTGMRVDLRPATQADALQLLESGQVDVIAGLPEGDGPERFSYLEQRFDCTNPLFDLGIGVFARKDRPERPGGHDAAQPEPLAGLVQDERVVEVLVTAFPHLRQQRFQEAGALAAALALDRVRVAAGPAPVLRHWLAQVGGPERFEQVRAFPGAELRALVRKGDIVMLERLNAGLQQLDPQEVKALVARHMDPRRSMPLWFPGAVAGAVCLLVGVVALLGARRVRAQAEAREHETEVLREQLLAETDRHRKTQELLSSAIEQSPSGIVIAYAGDEFPPVLNQEALRILGVREMPRLGQRTEQRGWRLYSAAGGLLAPEQMPLARTLSHGQSLENGEFRVLRADGTECWFLANAAPVRDAQGTVRAGVLVFHDITASRQAERELARFKFFLEAGVEEVYLLRPSGVLAYVNEAVARSLGYARSELHEIPLADIDPSFTPDAVYRLLVGVRQSPQTFEATHKTRDGRQVLKEIKAFYMRFGDEEYICGFGQDITERSRLERELHSTRALFAASLEQAPWGIIIGDAKTRTVTTANCAAAGMLGLRPGDLVGMDVSSTLPIWSFLDQNDQVVTPGETPLSRAIDRGESTRDLEVRFLLQGSPERWLLAHAAPVRDADGAVIAAILVMTDISRRKRMEHQLVFKAMHDTLTGLPNREQCLELLQRLVERNDGGAQAFAVAFVDLDRFKMLNDSLGHSFGDRVLMAAAARLSSVLEGQGQVCRFGGDEFVLLLDRQDSAEAAQKLIGEALTELGRPLEVEGQEIRLTASVGVVLGPAQDGLRAEDILQNADLAMHRAKDTGRDRVRLFHPGMLRRAQELLSLDADMRRGLARGEFLVFFQPVMAASSGEILGFEALARWRSPTRGLVQPHAFISHAEDSGLILPLGEQVLRQACQEMAALRRRLLSARRLYLSVNLSARQFSQPDLLDCVRQILRETGLPPALLKLELTESTLMGDPESALSAMRRLKALGLSLAIDDFGTGYSSLAYLQRFPVDVLKIDRSFVRDLPRADADSRGLVQAITALAGSLRLRVVAEGVETREQLDILVSMGCEAVQGYLFHPPLPVEALPELLKTAPQE